MPRFERGSTIARARTRSLHQAFSSLKADDFAAFQPQRWTLQQECEVSSFRNAKRSGFLFIAAGCMLVFAACLGKQVAFGAVGAVQIAVGASFLARARRA